MEIKSRRINQTMFNKNWTYIKNEKRKSMKNWSYLIPEGKYKGIRLWSGRYCAVTGIVHSIIEEDFTGKQSIFFLATKRGKGSADFQGKWCLPCGFLEANENGNEGVSREVYEETGIKISPDDFTFFNVETEPEKCNNGNVTLRYSCRLYGELTEPNYVNINGEADEVAIAKWINIEDIDKFDWAFGHKELIEEYVEFYCL